MAERRRRRRNSANSDSEHSEEETAKSSKLVSTRVARESECESEAGTRADTEGDEITETSEYDSDDYETYDSDETSSYDEETEEGSVVVEGEEWVEEERQSGDGEEQPPTNPENLDDDEDRKNPAYIPRKGAFYEHDMRLGEEDLPPELKGEERPKKKLWVDDGRWLNDRYDDGQQAPKSREELIAEYGYDIRACSEPPVNAPARNTRQYGPNRQSKLGDFIENNHESNDSRGHERKSYNDLKNNRDSYNKINRDSFQSLNRDRFDNNEQDANRVSKDDYFGRHQDSRDGQETRDGRPPPRYSNQGMRGRGRGRGGAPPSRYPPNNARGQFENRPRPDNSGSFSGTTNHQDGRQQGEYVNRNSGFNRGDNREWPQRDNRPQLEKPRDTKPQLDRPRDNRPPHERPRDNIPQHDRSRDNRPQHDRPRDNRPQHERPQHERPRDNRPQHERPRDNRPPPERLSGPRINQDQTRKEWPAGNTAKPHYTHAKYGDDRSGASFDKQTPAPAAVQTQSSVSDYIPPVTSIPGVNPSFTAQQSNQKSYSRDRHSKVGRTRVQETPQETLAPRLQQQKQQQHSQQQLQQQKGQAGRPDDDNRPSYVPPTTSIREVKPSPSPVTSNVVHLGGQEVSATVPAAVTTTTNTNRGFPPPTSHAPRHEAVQQTRPKRYSSQRQRGGPEVPTEAPAPRVPAKATPPNPAAAPFFVPVSVYAAPPPPRPSTVTPQASVPIFQSTDQSPPHTGASFPPPPTLQQPIAYTLPVSATEGLQGQNRLYTTVAPLSSVPPPAVVSASMPSAPPIVQGPYVAAPLVNYPPPPGPPSHFQMAGHVPVQFAAPPPPPPPPPPQVAQPATDVVQIRGGTTYFNPEIQPYNQGWSPARRVKVAIPIVNPQNLSEEQQGDVVYSESPVVTNQPGEYVSIDGRVFVPSVLVEVPQGGTAPPEGGEQIHINQGYLSGKDGVVYQPVPTSAGSSTRNTYQKVAKQQQQPSVQIVAEEHHLSASSIDDTETQARQEMRDEDGEDKLLGDSDSEEEADSQNSQRGNHQNTGNIVSDGEESDDTVTSGDNQIEELTCDMTDMTSNYSEMTHSEEISVQPTHIAVDESSEVSRLNSENSEDVQENYENEDCNPEHVVIEDAHNLTCDTLGQSGSNPAPDAEDDIFVDAETGPEQAIGQDVIAEQAIEQDVIPEQAIEQVVISEQAIEQAVIPEQAIGQAVILADSTTEPDVTESSGQNVVITQEELCVENPLREVYCQPAGYGSDNAVETADCESQSATNEKKCTPTEGENVHSSSDEQERTVQDDDSAERNDDQTTSDITPAEE